MDKHIVTLSENHEVWCYGTIDENSNFSCVFDDPDYDGIVADIDTSIYDTWEKIVKRICDNYNTSLEEITSC